MSTKPDIVAESPWQARIDTFAGDARRLRQCQRYVEFARLLMAIGLVVLISQLWSGPERNVWWWPAGVGILAFIALIFRHRQLSEQLEHCSILIALNQESLARVRRNFAQLPPCPAHVAGYFSNQDKGLNLYGSASLGQLLFNLSTTSGDSRLAEWLSCGSPLQQFEHHQLAVQELAPQLDLRQRLYAYARSPQHAGGHCLEHFQTWAADTTVPLVPAKVKRTGWLLTLALVADLLLVISRLAPPWIVAPAILLNLGFLCLHGRPFKRAFDCIDMQSGALSSLSRMVEIIGNGEYRTPALKQIGESLLRSPHRPANALRQLATIVHHSRLRFNAVPYLFLQSLLLWDFHVAMKLQRWRNRYARHVACWLETTSRFEALSALANLSHENPHWRFPELSDAPELDARQAVHPLLPPRKAVANDILLKPGELTVITGSNMSGKTTYMRTLGLNLKLAMAAGPVACTALRFPPCELYTAISASDSLDQGLSYFMSEVVQIKSVLAGVEQSRLQPVFLLDELLKGTNERERNFAIIAILKALCARRAMGLMTTHNVALATHPELKHLCRNVHFEEVIGDDLPGKLAFSYLLREGVSQQTNALKLLRLLGVALDD